MLNNFFVLFSGIFLYILLETRGRGLEEKLKKEARMERKQILSWGELLNRDLIKVVVYP